MNIEDLSEQASIKVIEALTISGAKAGCAKLWTWLTRNISENDSTTLKDIENNPEKTSSRTKAKGVLQGILEENSDRQKELMNILNEIQHSGFDGQTASANHGAKIVQASGSSHHITIS